MRNLIRGRYTGRYATATAKRWWSRSDRKAAKLAHAIVEHQFGDSRFQESVNAAVRAAIVTGNGALMAEARVLAPGEFTGHAKRI